MGPDAWGFDCPESPKRSEPDISESFGTGRKFPSVTHNVIHAVVQVWHHEHQGHGVIPSIHEPEHVHPHAHGFRRHEIARWRNGAWCYHFISGQPVGPVTISFHEHVHQAIGEHHFPCFMRVISHHPDWTMSIRLVIGVKVPRGQFFSFFRQPFSPRDSSTPSSRPSSNAA